METEKQVRNKISDFFVNSFKLFGKEIELETNQYFKINKIIDEEDVSSYIYHIQYGYPKSGCIHMTCSFSDETNNFVINDITIYAPSSEKKLILINVIPQVETDMFNMYASFGVDMKTEEHNDVATIMSNPNAIKMLDLAINDLNNANIIGECKINIPSESNIIQCTISKPKNRGKCI